MIAGHTGNRPKRPDPTRPATRVRACALALVIASGATAAGCGTSGSPASSGAPNKPGYAQLVKFSQCMRSHGVPGFPDPQLTASGGRGVILNGSPGGINPSSPAFQSAQQQCGKLLPNGGKPRGGAIPAQAKQQALRYSACIRSHGVPGFPDPQFSGGGMRLQLTPSSGVNRASPAFQAAQKACGSPFPGGIVKGNSAVGGPS
jgi:hypothetical protein